MESHLITNKKGKLIAELFIYVKKSYKHKKELVKNIKESLGLCSSVVTRKINISVYPTNDKFIIKNMKGAAGFSDVKNKILIYINPTTGWQKALRETVAHELAHALALNYNKRITLRDHLVFEGIAEHFREHFIGGERAVWVNALSKKQSIKIFKEIKNSLGSKSDKLCREVFFGTGKYPRWSGYAIGYYIVNAYLKNQDKIDWKKIIKISPSTIIKAF